LVVAETKLLRADLVDAHAIALVHIASSDDSYAPLAAQWQSYDVKARAGTWEERLADERRHTLVAQDASGQVVGFVTGGAARRPECAELEIYAIHVLPDLRGRGVGTGLWNAACAALRGPALASLYVDTLAELRACSFYERHGGQIVERKGTVFHGAQRTHVSYRWGRGVPNGTQSQNRAV
jgi:ribosomal protein S18 acetylase RimI-like enzyme